MNSVRMPKAAASSRIGPADFPAAALQALLDWNLPVAVAGPCPARQNLYMLTRLSPHPPGCGTSVSYNFSMVDRHSSFCPAWCAVRAGSQFEPARFTERRILFLLRLRRAVWRRRRWRRVVHGRHLAVVIRLRRARLIRRCGRSARIARLRTTVLALRTALCLRQLLLVELLRLRAFFRRRMAARMFPPVVTHVMSRRFRRCRSVACRGGCRRSLICRRRLLSEAWRNKTGARQCDHCRTAQDVGLECHANSPWLAATGSGLCPA